MNPVAHVQAVAVKLGANAADDVRDLARDKLFHVLVGAVIVGAIADGRRHAIGAIPRAHQQIASSFRGTVGARGAIRGLLGETRRVVQSQVAINFIG